MKIKLLLFLFAISLFACNAPNRKNGKNKAIDGLTAIKYAEDFVKAQGYTKVPLKKNRLNEFVFEKGEYSTDTMAVLKFRYDMLNPESFATKQHGGSWTVGFKYMAEENNIGRAVTMDTLGKRILMQPGEVRIDWFYETK